MDIRVLNYFVTIAKEKSMTRAAEKLNITQPTLSRQIRDLEEDLGVTLFRRSSRELQLTGDGQYLYNRSLEILSLVNKTEENLTRKGEIAGDLHIGAAETASMELIALACESLTSLYPQVRLHFRSGNADAVFEGLDQGILDFGVIFGNSIPQKYQALELIRKDRWCAILPKDHELADKDSLSLADVIPYPLIVSNQSDVDRSIFQGLGDYRIVATYNLLYNAGLLVKAGVGIALGLDGILYDPELVTIPLAEQSPNKLFLIWRDTYDQTPTEQAFIEEVHVQLEQAR